MLQPDVGRMPTLIMTFAGLAISAATAATAIPGAIGSGLDVRLPTD